MRPTKVWEILSQFKNLCRTRGWRTSDNEDWIEANGRYHNFLWAREVHLSSFKRIAASMNCVVHEGLSYRIVKTSCSAWLFSQPPSDAVVKTVLDSPDLFSKIALYGLSPLLQGKKHCVKLNQTDSPVFQEFEDFLRREFTAKLEPLQSTSAFSAEGGAFTLQQLA